MGFNRTFLTLMGLAMAFSQLTYAQAAKAPVYVKGRIIIEARPGLSDKDLDGILSAHHGKRQRIGKSNMHIVDLPSQVSEKDVVEKLSHNPHLKFAERDQLVQIPGGSSTASLTNDPSLGSEWYISKINAPNAWDTTMGEGVTIAIIDSGVDSTHPDLAPNIVPGYNFYDNNSDTSDVCGHGTMVAGTAAAVGNNSVGVAGVAGKAKIMPIRVGYQSTSGCMGSWSAITSGVTYAADHGARIANLSWADIPTSSSVMSAAQYMTSKGGLVFAAAGNSNIDPGYAIQTTVVMVSATDTTDAKASFSNFGNWVMLSAPGTNIYTTARGGGYAMNAGTSFASPVAAAVGAMVMSANPNLSPSQVQSVMNGAVADLGAVGRDPIFGYGRVDAAKAVTAARNFVAPADTQPPSVSITSPAGGATVSGLASIQVSASDNVGVARVDLKVNGTVVASDSASPYTFSWDSKTLADGTATLVAVAYDAAGNQASSSSVSIKVANTVAPAPVTDTIAPSVGISSLINGAIISGNSVSVIAVASDNSGSAGISLTLVIDGAVKAQATGANLSYNWNIRKVKAGVHTIQVIAKDAAGNSASALVQVNK